MKIEKPRHDHKLTDLLKVCIFSLLMLAPLIASCSQWIYATINKNAYQSYSGTQTQFVQQKVNNVKRITFENTIGDNLYDNHEFDVQFDGTYYGSDDAPFQESAFLDECYVGSNEFNYMQFTVNDNCSLVIHSSIKIHDNQYAINNLVYEFQTFEYIDFVLQNDILENIPSLINEGFIIDCPIDYYEMVEVQATTLDNAFYYGVDQMTKSELFNWTQNTALYSGIKAMTDNLQIQTNAIAILLTYWFILTIIYIIVDIVLKLFTTITHLGTKD